MELTLVQVIKSFCHGMPPKSSLSVTLIFKYIFLCTGDGGGPLLCPGPNAMDIRSFDFEKEKKAYYQVS
jgi:hypothetical protein